MILRVRLFGAFCCYLGNSDNPLKLGKKQEALVALLITAADGRRTRAWIQNLLWPLTETEQQSGSLRQAIASIKRVFGSGFDAVFLVDHNAISVNLNHCEILGKPQDGVFLEGLNIAGASKFSDWLVQRRQSLAAGLDEAEANSPRPKLAALVRVRPSIAILPFVVVETDKMSPTFGDLVSSDISRYLSRAAGFDIISHLSCRTEQFKQTGVLELNSRFKIDYVVSGHARQSGSEVRLDLEVLDVCSAKIISAERFEAPAQFFLAGNFEPTEKISKYIVRALFDRALEKTISTQGCDVEAHTLLMSSIVLMHRQDLASVSLSRQQLESIIHRAPDLSVPLAWLAKWYVMFISQGWSSDVAQDAQHALDAVSLALRASPTCAFSHVILGLVQYQLFGNFKIANREFETVLSEDENNAVAWIMRGTLFAFEGRGREAVSYTDRARRLSPLEPGSYLFETLSATAHLADENYERALELCESSLAKNQHHISSLRAKTVALHGMGRQSEARATVKELLRLEPSLNINNYLEKHAAARFPIGQKWARALRDSGVPIN